MKFLLILLFFTAFSWAQAQECDCGAFVNGRFGELEVYPFDPIQVQSCEDVESCSSTCDEEWATITNNGDLDTVLENGETLGQALCDTLAIEGQEDVPPHEVFLYYRICDGPWQYDEEQSTAQVCCTAGTYHSCDVPP
nr:uncharacterized protein LOC123762608 isoform X1 [Procambarus clarkii]